MRVRLAVAATTATATAVTCRQLDRQRRPLQGCRAQNLTEVLPVLQTSGVGIVEGVVEKRAVDVIRSTKVYASMPTKMPKRAKDKPSKAWRMSAPGRYHQLEQTFDESDVKSFEQVEKLIWPLVEAFFQEDGIGMRGIYRSEMQILNALPTSFNQTWHSDNRSRGLSIIIPLVDFTLDNGPTQLLVGSHNSSWPLLAEHGAQTVQAPTGAVIAYDSRTYHRGLGNLTEEGRPALIFCYDREWSPPPGYSGVYGSIAHASFAWMLDMLSGGYIACASLCKGGGS